MSSEEIGIMLFETLTTLMTMPELQDSKPILNSSILTEFLYQSPEDVREKATLYLNKLLSQLYTTDSYGVLTLQGTSSVFNQRCSDLPVQMRLTQTPWAFSISH